jgi:dynein heavy chain
MNELYNDSDFKTPIIFVLSQGADPSSQMLKFALDMGYNEKLAVISLGQGQGKKADKSIHHAKQKGEWVLL